MNVSYQLAWWFFRALFRTYFQGRIYNADRIPRDGPLILAANHASYLDPPLLGSCVPRMVHMMARNSLFRYPVFGAVLRSWEAIPVDPKGGPSAGLKAILDRTLAGGAVLIFPEGTRSRTGQFQTARSGLGLVVLKSKAPVVPVRIWGSYQAYSPHDRLPKPRPIRIKFGHPIWFEQFRREAAHSPKPRLKEIYQEISEQVMHEIAELKPCEDKTRFP